MSWVLFDISSTAPASTWLTPSVAMNESTCSLTTMKPDTAPQSPQAATAMSAVTGVGKPVCSER